jgi:hypothetical protein
MSSPENEKLNTDMLNWDFECVGDGELHVRLKFPGCWRRKGKV